MSPPTTSKVICNEKQCCCVIGKDSVKCCFATLYSVAIIVFLCMTTFLLIYSKNRVCPDCGTFKEICYCGDINTTQTGIQACQNYASCVNNKCNQLPHELSEAFGIIFLFATISMMIAPCCNKC